MSARSTDSSDSEMTYTLTSHGRPLGRTGLELPPPSAGMRSWQFIPAPAFAEAEPLFAALPVAIEDSQEAIPTQGELEAFPEEERTERMREILLADPRMARFIELSERLEALDLALLDASGGPLEVKAIGVTELEIAPEAFREVLTSVDPGADLSAARTPPFYLLVAGMER
jgi:hypothetical protein